MPIRTARRSTGARVAAGDGTADGLQVTVQSCSVRWAADQTCAGTQRTGTDHLAFRSQTSQLGLVFTAVQRTGSSR